MGHRVGKWLASCGLLSTRILAILVLEISFTLYLFVFPLIAGAVMGIPLWLVLRRYLPQVGWWWVVVSAVGPAIQFPGMVMGGAIVWLMSQQEAARQPRPHDESDRQLFSGLPHPEPTTGSAPLLRHCQERRGRDRRGASGQRHRARAGRGAACAAVSRLLWSYLPRAVPGQARPPAWPSKPSPSSMR